MFVPSSTRSAILGETIQHAERNVHTVTAKEIVISSETITIHTGDAPHFIDVTDTVQQIIQRQGIIMGSALLFSKHTTAAVVANEHEPLLLEDMADLFTRLIPHTDEGSYRHDDFSIRTVNMTPEEKENAHAHCRHLFLGSSVQVPIRAGSLDLGRWQRLFFIELDRPRCRQMVVQLTGIMG